MTGRTGKTGRTCRTSRTGRVLDGVWSFAGPGVSFLVPWGTILVSGDTSQDTLGSRTGFLSVWGGFREHFRLLWDDLGHKSGSVGSRSGFLVTWEWNSHQNPML